MTEKLFYADSHLHSFTATVISCTPVKDVFHIVLDKTAFYPEGGGQPGDIGKIGDVEVFDTHEKGGDVMHYCREPIEPGREINCQIDWDRRFAIMQNHSGEHIISGYMHSLFGYENVGFHTGERIMTIDFSGELSDEDIRRVENLANRAVRENIPFNIIYPKDEELESLDYRSKLDLKSNVRLVEIPGIDICACCATHVSRTGEIGLIKIISKARHRGGTRITAVCGMNALDYVNMLEENAVAVSGLLSVPVENISAALTKKLEEQARKKAEYAELAVKYVTLLAENYVVTEENPVIFLEPGFDEPARRTLANKLAEKCGKGFAAVLSGSDEEGYLYIMVSAGADLKSASKSINSLISGRGGGSSQLISGSCKGRGEDIKKALLNFREN